MRTECGCGRPTAGARLCGHCAKTLAYSLPNIAAYYDDLETVATKRARYGNGAATKGSIGKAQPLPVDLRFAGRVAIGTQLRWDAENTVSTWARVVMAEQPEMHGPTCETCLHTSCHAHKRRVWPRDTLRSMCAYLDRQFRHVTSQEWAEAMLDEFTNLEARLARLVDRPADRWYAGKCSVDDCPNELYATVERGTVDCRACGIQHDVAERRDFLLREAKDYHVTATEAAGALLAWTDYDGTEEKLVDRIRKWRDREKLAVADVTSLLGKDRHLYRLGDIQALMIERAQHVQSRRVAGAS